MQRVQTTCLVTLTTIAIGFSLKFLASVLLPFVIACFVVIGIRPILETLQTRLGLNRLVAVVVAFLTGLAGLGIIGLMIAVSVNEVANNADAYQERLTTIGTWVEAKAEKLMGKSDGTDAPIEDSIDERDQNSAIEKKDETNESVPQQKLSELVKQMDSILVSLVGSMSTLLSQGIMILLFVFFLLMGDDRTKNKSPDDNRPKIISDIESDVRKYLVLKTIISVITGLIFGGILWLFNVPLAIVFGMLAFLLNYIPNIGPLLANILPIPFLVLNSEISPTAAITCMVLICTVQFISGNVVETRLMGKSLDVSPVVLLLALMFFGLVWGIVGMFLATPLVSILKIALQNTKSGQPAAELLAGRWSVKSAEQA